MVTTQFIGQANNLFRLIERFLNSRFWVVRAALLLSIISVAFTYPRYYVLPQLAKVEVAKDSGKTPSIPQMLARQIEDPLYKIPSYGGAQVEKRQFRLLMPVIGHMLHLKVVHLVLLQQLFGIVLLGALVYIGFLITGDRVLGFLFTLGLSFTYLGTTSFTDVWPFFDGVAFTFLALAMAVRRPLLIMFFILCACFTDERAFIASPLIFLWWKFFQLDIDKLNFRNLIRPDKLSSSVVLGLIAYLGIRFFLVYQFGFETHTGGITGDRPAILRMYPGFLFGVLTGIEYFWLVIAAGCAMLLAKRQYLYLIVLLGCIGISTAAAILVFDVTKSATYVFPAIFIALVFLWKSGFSLDTARNSFLILALICLLLPNYSITGPFNKYMAVPAFLEFIKSSPH